jgi:hypothetical protein
MTEQRLLKVSQADVVEVIKETPTRVKFKSYYLSMDGTHTEALNTLFKNSGRVTQKVLDKQF